MTQALQVDDLIHLRVWTQFAAAKQAAVNSAWYTVASIGDPPATDADFATAMDAAIGPVMKPLLSAVATCEYRGVQVTVNNSDYPYKNITLPVNGTAAAGAGTGGDIPMPTQTCGLIRFQATRPGPGGRGRWYLPFPPQDSDSGGGSPSNARILLQLDLAAVVGVNVALSEGGRTANLVRVLVHSPYKGSIPGLPSPVQDFISSTLWATQRRRGNYGRTNSSPI